MAVKKKKAKIKSDDFCGKSLRPYLYVIFGLALAIVLSAFLIKGFDGSDDRHDRRDKRKEIKTQETARRQASRLAPNLVARAVPGMPRGNSFRNIAEQARHSVVNISSVSQPPHPAAQNPDAAGKARANDDTKAQNALMFADPLKQPGYQTIGLGSGLVIHPDGYILTNYHVVEKAGNVMVTFFLGNEARQLPGKVVKKDAASDLALVQVNPGQVNLEPVILGNSTELQVGDWVIAVGSPWGLDQTVTFGIVSGIRRSVMIQGTTHYNIIQTDAAINQGNSGGPLLNVNGEVIGINSAIVTPSGAFAGVGFAIPVDTVKTFLAGSVNFEDVAPARNHTMAGQMARNVAFTGRTAAPPIPQNAGLPHPDRGACENCHIIKDVNVPIARQVALQGETGIPYMGVDVQKIDRVIAKQFNLPVKDGVIVNDVVQNSPAERVGLMPGDVIAKIDGKWIADPVEFNTILGQKGVGETIRLTVFRGDTRNDLYTTLTARPADFATNLRRPAGNPQEIEWLGMELAELKQRRAMKMGLGGGERGMIVLEVEELTPAGDAGLMTNDLIHSVNRMEAQNYAAFMEAVKMTSLADGVLLEVNRNGRSFFVTIK